MKSFPACVPGGTRYHALPRVSIRRANCLYPPGTHAGNDFIDLKQWLWRDFQEPQACYLPVSPGTQAKNDFIDLDAGGYRQVACRIKALGSPARATVPDQ